MSYNENCKEKTCNKLKTPYYNKENKQKQKKYPTPRIQYKNCISITRGCIDIATKIYL